MKPKKRGRPQKPKAKKSSQKHLKSSGAKNPSPKARSKTRKKRKGLSFEQICRRLKPEHEALLKRFARFARWRAKRTKLPQSEAVALEALIRAVVVFRSRYRIESKRLRALFRWVRLKIEFALRNLAAEYPASAVRDAFINFELRFGYKPTLRELAKFGGFNPRHILNVWKEVAEELHLTPDTDTVMRSLVEELADWLRPQVESNTELSLRVRQVLARLPAADACLLTLKYLCHYTEEEILGFLWFACYGNISPPTQDEGEALLDQFVGAKIHDLAVPWDPELLKIRTRGHLAIRLYRARRRAAWS